MFIRGQSSNNMSLKNPITLNHSPLSFGILPTDYNEEKDRYLTSVLFPNNADREPMSITPIVDPIPPRFVNIEEERHKRDKYYRCKRANCPYNTDCRVKVALDNIKRRR
jgi:hypothetical protein